MTEVLDLSLILYPKKWSNPYHSFHFLMILLTMSLNNFTRAVIVYANVKISIQYYSIVLNRYYYQNEKLIKTNLKTSSRILNDEL
jgi:hypothetical protein